MNALRLLSRTTTRRGLAASVHTEAKLAELGYTLPTVYVAFAVVALCHYNGVQVVHTPDDYNSFFVFLVC